MDGLLEGGLFRDAMKLACNETLAVLSTYGAV